MRCFYSDTFVLPLPEGHRFPMAKYSGLRERLLRRRHRRRRRSARGAAGVAGTICGSCTRAEYLQAVEHGTLPREAQRRSAFRGRRRWSSARGDRSAQRLRLPRAALQDGCAANLAGGTHHAFADRGEGYCVFNDVAVASASCSVTPASGAIAIVDCDVHQGNGTAAIFAGDADVFTFSLHGAKKLPVQQGSAATSTSSWRMAPAMSRIWRILHIHWTWSFERIGRRSSSIWPAPIRTKAIGWAG